MSDPPWIAPLEAAKVAHQSLLRARHAQLATIGADGRPANRTVVVRGRLDPGGCVLMTTDARSAKVEQLASLPWAELCWCFSETREQFRLAGRVVLVGPEGTDGLGEVREKVWKGLPDASKRSFAGPPPGAPRAEDSAFAVPVPEEPPECFLLLVLEPGMVEYLDLRPDPHLRVRHQLVENGEWTSEGLNP